MTIISGPQGSLESWNWCHLNGLVLRILNLSLKLFYHVCNCNAKSHATPFSAAWEVWGCCGTNVPTELVTVATHKEFDRFFTIYCDPNLREIYESQFQTFFTRKKGKKHGSIKMPVVRKNKTKCFRISYLLQIYITEWLYEKLSFMTVWPTYSHTSED